MTTDFSRAAVEEHIQESIKPALDLADARLDHYLDGAPVEVWPPIADRFNPDIGVIEVDILPDISRWKELAA